MPRHRKPSRKMLNDTHTSGAKPGSKPGRTAATPPPERLSYTGKIAGLRTHAGRKENSSVLYVDPSGVPITMQRLHEETREAHRRWLIRRNLAQPDGMGSVISREASAGKAAKERAAREREQATVKESACTTASTNARTAATTTATTATVRKRRQIEVPRD